MFRLMLLTLALATVCSAVEGVSLLPAQPTGTDAPTKGFAFGDHTKHASATTVAVSGQAFTKALRIAVVGKAEQLFQVNHLFVVPAKVAKGEVIELSCWVRGTADGGATPSLSIVHQLKDTPWTASINKEFALTGEWTHLRVAWKAVADWEGGSHRVAFFLGKVADQQIEFGSISLLTHGQIDPQTLGIPVYVPPAKK